MLWLLLVPLVIFLVWYKLTANLNYFNKLGINQTKPWPLIGDQWVIMLRRQGMAELLHDIYRMYPKSRYVGFFLFSTPILMIRDPELIKRITIRDFDHFTDHQPMIPPEADLLWGKNLFNLKGQEWKEMRATLSASFTSSKMKQMFDTMNEAAENFVQHFLKKEEATTVIEMKDTFSRYTNDVIASSAFGIKVDSLAEPDNLFYRSGKKLTALSTPEVRIRFMIILMLPTLMMLLKVSVFNEKAKRYFKRLIYETIDTREKNGIIRHDMLNQLLKVKHGIQDDEPEVDDTSFAIAKESHLDKIEHKQPRQMTNYDIASQALIFFLAGFETISTALSFGTYELAINPEIQDKLRKEILETHKANNGKLTYDILTKMKYMDMTFTEILRKWPPISGVDRLCTKAYTIEPEEPEEKPVHLNVGDVLFIPMIGFQRDAKYFPDPEKFDPERFSDENKDNVVPYTFLSFGSGPRNCIGSRFSNLEAKAMLYHLLLNFKILPTKHTQIPLKLDPTYPEMAPLNGQWLGLQRIGK